MKIVLFLNQDIHCKSAFSLLSESLKHHEVKIILSQKVGKVDDLPKEIMAMRQLEKWEITEEFSSYEDINSAQAFADLKKFSPDLMISIRFGQIFKNSDLIRLPRFGIINLHSGILPDYRGIMASFWAILHGEKNLGMTLHYVVDSGIDTGGIIDVFKSEIDWNLPLISNIANLYPRGCEMIVQTMKKIFSGERINTIDQAALSKGPYFSYPTKADVEKFLQEMKLY